MRLVTLVLILILSLVGTSLSQGVTKKPPKTIKGRVVAENISNRFLGCWHVCTLSLLVRLESQKTPEFAAVSVTFMDDRGLPEKGPHWKLVEETGRWKFKAVQDDPAFVVLNQFAKTIDISTGAESTNQVQMTQWIPLKGSEREELPFGRSIASYTVEVGQFKPIK